MTATTAPVKSFDSLRVGPLEACVTRNRKSNAAPTQPMMMRMLFSTIVGPRWTPREIKELTPLFALPKHDEHQRGTNPFTAYSPPAAEDGVTPSLLLISRQQVKQKFAAGQPFQFHPTWAVDWRQTLRREPQHFVLGAGRLGKIDELVDQFGAVVCIEVQRGNFTLLQRFVRV